MSDILWEPIETAPKDGSWFVVYTNGEYEVGRFHQYMNIDYIEEPVGSGSYSRRVSPSAYCWDGFNNFHRATHWMPIPEAPK